MLDQPPMVFVLFLGRGRGGWSYLEPFILGSRSDGNFFIFTNFASTTLLKLTFMHSWHSVKAQW